MDTSIPLSDKKPPKISVVTVCFNAVDEIEQTMLSVLNQTYPNIEYIIIDGGSTDGTVDLIKKYADRLAYWISEPDKGLYDAMNKGIDKASGDYINFMNAGDIFYNHKTIENAINLSPFTSDVIYGDSYRIEKDRTTFRKSLGNFSLLAQIPIYRHGASFTKLEIHKKIKFDLSKEKEFYYGLDYNQIWTLYTNDYKFERINLPVLIYNQEGISNNPFKGMIINHRITNQNKSFFHKYILLYYKIILWHKNSIIKYIYNVKNNLKLK